MSNNIFYKALTALNTISILVIAASLCSIATQIPIRESNEITATENLASPAKSYWLILSRDLQSLQKIEMSSMAQCKEQGSSWREQIGRGYTNAQCLIGK